MATDKELEHYLRQLRKIEEHREENCEKEVKRLYEELLSDLQGFLGKTYAELAVDDKLTYEILHGKGKYARFLEEVEQRVNTFAPDISKEIRKTVQDTYKAAYDSMVDAVTGSSTYNKLKSNLKGLRSVTPSVMKRAIENPISGLTLNDTLEKNRRGVIYDIKQAIGIGLSQGDRMSTMARRITDKVNMSYGKSIRIVRTETHRVREAGYQDASERISQRLRDDNSNYVMTKTWKTMQDEAVRPQRRYKTKKGWKTSIRANGPNHMKMHGVIVLVDEEFDLGNGVTALAPGQSGVAGHDINCRCYLSRDMMTKEEFTKLTGRKFEQTEADKIAQEEQKLIDEKEQLEQDKEAAEQELNKLLQNQYSDDMDIYDVGDYLDNPSDFDELQSDYHKWYDLTDKNEVDKLLKSVVSDDASTIIDYGRADFKNMTTLDKMKLDKMLDDKYASWYDSLTDDEKLAIKRYTGHGYGSINGYIRSGVYDSTSKYSEEQIQTFIKNLDSAIGKQEITQPMNVYRYVGTDVFGTDDLSKLVGTTFTDKGYMSTTIFEDRIVVDLPKNNVGIKIRVPKGTNGAYVDMAASYTHDEYEFMLGRNTTLRFTDYKDGMLYAEVVEDASEKAKILGSYFETELGFDKAREYGLTSDYLLKYESKDLDNLTKHVTNMTGRLHDDIQDTVNEIDDLVSSGKRYTQLKSQISQIDDDLESISDELNVLKIKKYEAKGITVDDLYSDVQKRKDEIEELSKQVKGKAKLSDIKVKDVDEKQLFKILELDDSYDIWDYIDEDMTLDDVVNTFYQYEPELSKEFINDVQTALDTKKLKATLPDNDDIKDLIKTKKDELRVLEADLDLFVDTKAKAMQKELIKNVDDQIDDLKNVLKKSSTKYDDISIEDYINNESTRKKLQDKHNYYEDRIKQLKKEDELAKDCITIGDRPQGISAAQYLDDKATKRFVDDEWKHLQKAHKEGTLKDWEVERYNNYKKFFDDIDEYNKNDDIAIKLKNARKEKKQLEDFIVEADDYADKLKKLEKEKEKVTKEVEKFKNKYTAGDVPRTSSAKVLDDLQEYADKQKAYKWQLQEIANDLGVSTDEAREMLSDALKSITDECDIGIRIRGDNLEKVLDSGEFKNLFETGTSGGCTDTKTRRRAEDNAFGFAVDTLDEDRPIYGMMIPNLDVSRTADDIDYILNGPGGHYGDGVTVVINKNKVRHNSSFTLGDSLDDEGMVAGSLFDDAIYNGGSWEFLSGIDSLMDSSKSVSKKLTETFEEKYIEVQIHGKDNHGSDIIDKIYFTKLAGDRAKKTGLLDKLTGHGIPYEILD